jgi:Uma2 family endonuclease
MATAPSSRVTLESGDRLTPEEFDRIYEQLPDVRAELINGKVYIKDEDTRREVIVSNGYNGRMATAPSSRVTLESGDRLTPEEFDRIYAQMPNVRAELIDGVVYVSSPVKFHDHGRPQNDIGTLIGTFRASNAGEVDSCQDATFITDANDRVQPDGCVFKLSGSAYIDDEDGYMHGSPEFVVEISASSATYDLHDKLDIYRRAGVREYLVWRVLNEAFDLFHLTGDNYVRIDPNPDGMLVSTVFPGLRIHTRALIEGDLATALAALR